MLSRTSDKSPFSKVCSDDILRHLLRYLWPHECLQLLLCCHFGKSIHIRDYACYHLPVHESQLPSQGVRNLKVKRMSVSARFAFPIASFHTLSNLSFRTEDVLSLSATFPPNLTELSWNRSPPKTRILDNRTVQCISQNLLPTTLRTLVLFGEFAFFGRSINVSLTSLRAHSFRNCFSGKDIFWMPASLTTLDLQFQNRAQGTTKICVSDRLQDLELKNVSGTDVFYYSHDTSELITVGLPPSLQRLALQSHWDSKTFLHLTNLEVLKLQENRSIMPELQHLSKLKEFHWKTYTVPPPSATYLPKHTFVLHL